MRFLHKKLPQIHGPVRPRIEPGQMHKSRAWAKAPGTSVRCGCTFKIGTGSLATLPIGHLRPYPLKTRNTVTCDPTSFYLRPPHKTTPGHLRPYPPLLGKTHPGHLRTPTYTDR